MPQFKVLSCFLSCALMACGSEDGRPTEQPDDRPLVTPAAPGAPWETLGEWHVFANGRAQTPAKDVVPYRVIAELYADEATKHRFMWIPPGTTVEYAATSRWAFPVGTILVKTFGYSNDARDPAQGERLLETRLLVHDPEGWQGHTYVWNAEQTEAERKSAGATIPVSFIDVSGVTRQNDYGVPNANQCPDCHGMAPLQDTLGGRTRQLDRDYDYGKGATNQIDHLTELGWFASPPPPVSERERLVDPFGTAPLNERVRSYLDSNCGHCHGAGGNATDSGMLLAYEDTQSTSATVQNGVCKIPTSAGGATCGLTYDIVPGSADQSILTCRMMSKEPKVRMPPLATKLPHERALALLREWIDSMPPSGCN